MDEYLPHILRSPSRPARFVSIYIGIEYFHEYIIGERVDCHQAYVGGVSVVRDTVQTTYVDLVLDQTLSGGVQKYRASRGRQIRYSSVPIRRKAIMTGRSE